MIVARQHPFGPDVLVWSCNPGLVQAYRLTDSDVTELLDTPEEDEYDYRSSCCLSCASLHSWSPLHRFLYVFVRSLLRGVLLARPRAHFAC